MRRLFLVASVMTIAAGVVHCSKTTELVVAVDTDLVPSAEVDRIQVAVDGPSGRVFDKPADIVTSSSLPLTVGVAAGSSEDAEVQVVATAFKSGLAVARTEVIARFAPGESRLVQVSLCKSCGLTCGRNLGSSLPEWNDSLPAKHACDTTFADAGGFDSGRPVDAGGDTSDDDAASGDGSVVFPDASDAAIEASPSECANRCGSGSTCVKGGACLVTGVATCPDPVAVGMDGGAFFGTFCKGDAGTFATTCGKTQHGFVFSIANTGAGQGVVLGPRSAALVVGPLDGTCTRTGACASQGGSTGPTTIADAPAGSLYGVGFDPDGGGCQNVSLTFTPR